MKHETGKSGHGWGPCSYRCVHPSCGMWFTNSLDLRQHCRDEFRALPKRYCTKVEAEAMAVLPAGLCRNSNTQPTGSQVRALDEIFTRQFTSVGSADSVSAKKGFSPPKRDGLRAYRSPNLSPKSPSSSGSRENRSNAHHFNALEGLNSDSVVNTGYVRVYQRYVRSRSPPRFARPAKAPDAPAPRRTIFGQGQ